MKKIARHFEKKSVRLFVAAVVLIVLFHLTKSNYMVNTWKNKIIKKKKVKQLQAPWQTTQMQIFHISICIFVNRISSSNIFCLKNSKPLNWPLMNQTKLSVVLFFFIFLLSWLQNSYKQFIKPLTEPLWNWKNSDSWQRLQYTLHNAALNHTPCFWLNLHSKLECVRKIVFNKVR